MLQLQIQTSSTDMIPMPNIKYLREMARCAKCQMYVLLRSTNCLYGFSDDCCAIHELPVPFKVDTDLMFRQNTMDQKVVRQYKQFFVPEKYPYVIIPDYYWDMYIGGDIEEIYDEVMDRMILIDKTTMAPIVQFFMFERRYNTDFMRMDVLNQLERFLKRRATLGSPIHTIGLEKHPAIRDAYDNKAAHGNVLVNVNMESDFNESIPISFYIWKGMFTLNKDDTLWMEARFDMAERGTFMATFYPKRKKNPMELNTYGVPFEERIHCMYRNIAF